MSVTPRSNHRPQKALFFSLASLLATVLYFADRPFQFFSSSDFTAVPTVYPAEIISDTNDHSHVGRKLIITSFLSWLRGENDGSVSTPHLAIEQINEPGFGDLANQYSFSMASFQDHVFIGTLNSPAFMFNTFFFFFGIGTIGPLTVFDSNGSQVYRGTRRTSNEWTFERVLDFGDSNKNNFGSRKMLVVGDFLYLATANHIDGLEIWQTSGSGDVWNQVSESGFGDASNISGRSLAVCGDHLYAGVENRDTGAQVWRHRITTNGDLDVDGSSWEVVMGDGFGDDFNFFVSELVVYKNRLYGSTLNGLNGGQLWRTEEMCDSLSTTSNEDIVFENVITGGFGSRLNSGILTLFNLDDKALFLGTVNYIGGSSLYKDVPGSDGSEFEAVFKRGFTSIFNSYIWAMESYQGRVYIGTYNQLGSIFPWSTFHLFSFVLDDTTLEVEDLTVENRHGFSSNGQYGIRNMVAHDNESCMVMGTGGHRMRSGTLVFEAK